jgi:multiple sugar transport system permease protein
MLRPYPVHRATLPPAMRRRTLPTAGEALVTLAALLMLAPVAVLVLGALHPADRLTPQGLGLLPVPPSLGGLERAFALEPLGAQLGRSALVTAIAVPLSVLFASWAAFALLLAPPRQRRIGLGIVLALLCVPPAALWVPRFVLFSQLGLVDTYVPLVAPALLGTTPLAILLLHWSFRRIPRELLDAAALEGLGPLRTWWRVAEPLTRPTAYAVAALVVVAHWGDLTNALLFLLDRELWTLPLGVRSVAAATPGADAVGLAAALVAALPPVALVFVLSRRLR